VVKSLLFCCSNASIWYNLLFQLKDGGGGATRPLPRDRGMEKLHGDPTVGPHPKVWIKSQKWKKLL